MVEWFKAAVLKTAEGQLSEGSNPSSSAIFFIPLLIYLKKSSLLLFCKTRWLKGFYNISASVQETHSDSEIRPFFTGFCLKSVWILSFSEKCKNQGSFCKCLIINKVLFLYLTEQGETYENGACFYQPPFLSGKFTLKILTLQTYLVGGRSENAGKFLSAPNGLFGFLPTFYPQKTGSSTVYDRNAQKNIKIWKTELKKTGIAPIV